VSKNDEYWLILRTIEREQKFALVDYVLGFASYSGYLAHDEPDEILRWMILAKEKDEEALKRTRSAEAPWPGAAEALERKIGIMEEAIEQLMEAGLKPALLRWEKNKEPLAVAFSIARSGAVLVDGWIRGHVTSERFVESLPEEERKLAQSWIDVDRVVRSPEVGAYAWRSRDGSEGGVAVMAEFGTTIIGPQPPIPRKPGEPSRGKRWKPLRSMTGDNALELAGILEGIDYTVGVDQKGDRYWGLYVAVETLEEAEEVARIMQRYIDDRDGAGTIRYLQGEE